MTDTVTTAKHYHAWLRSGRVFSMVCRRFATRQYATKWSKGQRAAPGDRMVLACDRCPTSKRSTRPAPRWASIAAALGVDPELTCVQHGKLTEEGRQHDALRRLRAKPVTLRRRITSLTSAEYLDYSLNVQRDVPSREGRIDEPTIRHATYRRRRTDGSDG